MDNSVVHLPWNSWIEFVISSLKAPFCVSVALWAGSVQAIFSSIFTQHLISCGVRVNILHP